MDRGKLKKVKTRKISCGCGYIKGDVFEVDKAQRKDGCKYFCEYETHFDIDGSVCDQGGSFWGENVDMCVDGLKEALARLSRSFARDLYGDDWDVYGEVEFDNFYA